MLRITNPVPTYLDGQGGLLDNGQIYIGVANQDPKLNQIQVFWDQALTIPAVQPLRTLAGTIRNGATPAYAYVAQDDFSMMVADSNGAQISYSASYKLDNQGYQPLDSDLTAIAALSTTAFGRNLLTMGNQAALISALGGLNFLPLSGGTMQSDITRQGSGKYVYYNDATYSSGRIFVAAVGSSDPSSAVGDMVFYIAP